MASTADQVPLLGREGDAQGGHPDVRFAIDDEMEAYSDHGESSRPIGRIDDESAPQHSETSPSSRSAAHKYPPHAPPPSYREATGKSAITIHLTSLFSNLTTPDLSTFKSAFSRSWAFIYRFWPTSRFAQLGLFMAGLWLLVIVSGPAFDESGPHAGSGYPWGGIDQLSEHGPGPISGDGHVLSYANWTLKSCHNNNEHRGKVVCTSTTRVELDIPEGFHSTEGIFFFADPPRHNHLTDGRGHVPGTIEIKLVEQGTNPDQSPIGKAQVIIDAEYEQSRGEIFERSTVAKMAAGISSQGVGIYTYPLPAHYAAQRPPLLVMHVKILIPSGAVVPALKVQASGMSIGAFVDPPAIQFAESSRRRALRSGVHASWPPLQNRAPSPQRAALIAPRFGRFIVQTAVTSVRLGPHVALNAIGLIKATTYNGDIIIEGELHSAQVRLETMTGSVRLEENSHVMAWRESRVISQTGNIELKRNSWLYSSQILARTDNGNILGGGSDAGSTGGVWKTNQTLEMQTSNGAMHASCEVHAPTDAFLNPSKNVRVEAESKNGIVDVVFVAHDADTSLQAKITTSVGRASARMHRAFVGNWRLEGSQGASKVIAPTDGREFHQDAPKKGMTKRIEQGTVGRQDTDVAKSSRVLVHSSLGSAELSFA